jgi:predicted enzyme related to lactoylglutathione lyase
VALVPHDRESSGVGGAFYCGLGFVSGIHGNPVLFDAGDGLSKVLAKVSEGGGSILMTKTAINNNNDHIAYITDGEGNRLGLHSKH